jgi:hypothetical protein
MFVNSCILNSEPKSAVNILEKLLCENLLMFEAPGENTSWIASRYIVNSRDHVSLGSLRTVTLCGGKVNIVLE